MYSLGRFVRLHYLCRENTLNDKIFTYMKRFLMRVALLFSAVAMAVGAYGFESGQTVRLECGGRSLMTENSTLDAGKAAVLWTETGTNSQRWTLEDNGKGLFYLRNVYSGYYLGGITASSGGAQVGVIDKSAAGTRGIWVLEPVEGETDTYYIYFNTLKRFALASQADVTEGSTVTMQTASTTDAARIKWKVTVCELKPNHLTAEIRDDMMNRWRDHYYHQASTGHVIGNGGWWGDAEMFEVVLDALETTGDAQYAEMFDELYKNFCKRNNTDWSGNEFNDDIAWMCIACARAYLLTGNTEYRTRSKENFDKMYSRANIFGDGTLCWKQGGTSTNSCINGPAAVCACYLGLAFNSEAYFQKAASIYAGERAILFNINSAGVFNGEVWDSYSHSANSYNKWASTYNQGTNMGAAIMLYNHFGTPQYKSDADAIMSYTAKNMANGWGVIKACQTVKGDLSGFKGILMRYIRRYAADFEHPEYYEWMAKNAFHAWNNRNSVGISMSAWLHKTTEDFYYSDGGDFNTDGVGAFTAVSAAFNAHLGAVDRRNAYERMEAEQFNRIFGATVTDCDDDTTRAMGPVQHTQYIGYRRVNFGSRMASHCVMRLKFLRASGRIRVYADDPTRGTLLCTFNAADATNVNGWETVTRELDVPIGGEHDIYLVGNGIAKVNLAEINWFTFEANYTMFADLTNNGGSFACSESLSAAELDALFDDSPETEVLAVMQGDAERWIEYRSPAPIVLQGYSLFSGITANTDPTAWRLEASNDGSQWTLLDERSEQTFSVRGQKKQFDVSTDGQAYTHFRLVFTATTSAVRLSLGEWQLLGRAIDLADVTADGGIVGAGCELVVDHNAETSATLALPADVTYQSNGNYVLTAYSLTVKERASAPTSWTLYGSNNGKTWVEMDRQPAVDIAYDGCTTVCRLRGTTPYIYYKLTLEGEGEACVSEFQLIGRLDYGTFYSDMAQSAVITGNDGRAVAALTDNDGATAAALTGDDMSWAFDFPLPIRVVGYSAVCSDDAALDPQSIVLSGTQDGVSSTLSSRTLSFAARGSRATVTVSSTKTFEHLDFAVRSTAGGANQAQLAELEIYGTAIAEAGSSVFPTPETFTASAAGVSTSEGIEKANDQVRTTKYRTDFSKPVSIDISYAEPQTVDAYAITAAKDEATRDPRAWTLFGSADGQTWEELDAQADEAFSHRYATQFYPLAEPKAYAHFRLTVNEVCGGDQLQLGQLQLLTLADKTAVGRVTGEVASLTLRGATLEVQTPQATTLRIYDAQGRMVLATPVAAGIHLEPLHSLPTGIYVAAVQVGGRNVIRKFAK